MFNCLGLVVGVGVLVLILLITVIILCCRKKKAKAKIVTEVKEDPEKHDIMLAKDDDSIANQPDCKPGQECHISQMSVNGAPLTATHDSPDAAPIPLVKADIPPRLLSSIWRPPLPPTATGTKSKPSLSRRRPGGEGGGRAARGLAAGRPAGGQREPPVDG